MELPGSPFDFDKNHSVLEKLEVPTDLSYVTKRNWSEEIEQQLILNGDEARIPDYRLSEPIILHVNYHQFLTDVLRRLDATTQLLPLTSVAGTHQEVAPVERQDVASWTTSERLQQGYQLASQCINIVQNIIQMRDPYVYTREEMEALTAAWEAYAAQLIAPYREEQAFLAEVVQSAQHLQMIDVSRMADPAAAANPQ